MKTCLIVGVETVVGANLAASWSGQTRVVGLASASEITISGCERAVLERHSIEGIRKCLQQTRASQVIFCGSAARSTWEPAGKAFHNSDAESWAAAAAELSLHFTMISSDAIFTGPWMFHDETSTAVCPSAEATEIRGVEARVRVACERSLIVRTNALGWSPTGSKGWLESLLSGLESQRAIELDPICHATPILASDLADYLEPALDDELTGTFHIAGAERVSPHQFVKQLATAFELSSPASRTIRELIACPTGFGRGETSLQSRRFRNEYECAMPLLSEGITRLVEQHRSGHRDRLCGHPIRQGRAA